MKMSDAFPSKYITAADLQGRGHLVRIRGVVIENVGKDQERRPVVYFEGKKKGLILNKTNGKKITLVTGEDDTDLWPGKSIIIYPTMVQFGDEEVEGIRVKPAGVPEPAAVVNRDEPPPPSDSYFPGDEDPDSDLPF